MRIATLLPSATEIVCALGLEDQLVAISHSCTYPDSIRSLPRVTSTRVPYTEDSETIDSFVRSHLAHNDALYDLDLATLRRAEPDVIVSQGLCDVCAVSAGDVVDALQSLPSSPTLIDLTPVTLDDVLDDIRRVANKTAAHYEAERVIEMLRTRIERVASRSASIPLVERPTVGFLEWLVPPFSGGHWSPELVELAGGVDSLGIPGRPSITQRWEDIQEADPDVLFIACCGFDVDRTREDLERCAATESWRRLKAVKDKRVYVADGDYFSCPGPRLIQGLEMLAHALHPDIHPRALHAQHTMVYS